MSPINIPQPTADTNDTGDAKDKPKRNSFIAYAFYISIVFIVGEFLWATKAYHLGIKDCQTNKQVEIQNAVEVWKDRYEVEYMQHASDNRQKDSIINVKDSIIADKYETIFDLIHVHRSGSTIKITK